MGGILFGLCAIALLGYGYMLMAWLDRFASHSRKTKAGNRFV